MMMFVNYRKFTHVFIAVAITIVIFTNIYISLTLYGKNWRPEIISCVDGKVVLERGVISRLSTKPEVTDENISKVNDHKTRKVNDGVISKPDKVIDEMKSDNLRKISTEKFNVADLTNTQNIERVNEKKYTHSAAPDEIELPRSIKSQIKSEKKRHNDKCPINKIHEKKKSSLSNDNLICQPHQATNEACLFAEKTYAFNSSLLDCEQKFKADYCFLESEEKSGNAKSKSLIVKCVLPEYCKSMRVYGIDEKGGDLQEEGIFDDLSSLENGIQELIDNSTAGFQFVFIECVDQVADLQLLFWNKRSARVHTVDNNNNFNSHNNAKSNNNNININIVLLDSISRAHFYRSLPLAIAEFERQNLDSSGGEVLDFSLFQSVHGHSVENAHALFTGSLLPETISDTEREDTAVGVEVLFKMFKSLGYQTMYQDDLCWTAVWGLRKELGTPRSWKQFLEKINESYIDDTGLTFASCQILKSNNLRNPFSESKNNQICFNNRFQHDYILDFSKMFHEDTHSPTISYTALNTAHDWHGIRTQTLNRGLVDYVKQMSTFKNTITLILADHGNTYTPFVRKILEGRYEMYHPSFFMLIPQNTADALGSDVMDALRANQKRLLTMLDINAGFQAIAHLSAHGVMPDHKGIFSPIPTERKCSDLEMRLPNLCVCDGWESEAANDSVQVSVVEFGIGMLNNRIEQQRWKYHQGKSANSSVQIGPRKCQHLVPLYFKNVRERNNGDSLVTMFDFVVASGDGIDQKEDIFHVETESTIKPGITENLLKLLNFDRLSRYGPYTECVDDGVDVKLCVCSLAKTNDNKEPGSTKASNDKEPRLAVNTLWKLLPKFPGINSKSMLYNRMNEPCIYIISRYYYGEDNGKIDKTKLHTATLEAVNFCPDARFSLEVELKPKLMKISGPPLFQTEVEPNSLQFLCLLATENVAWPTSFTFTYAVEKL